MPLSYLKLTLVNFKYNYLRKSRGNKKITCDDYKKTKYYAEDKYHLLKFPEKVMYFEI